ncbi:M3 family oligoendopeptidase [Paenibacillus sp. N3/727]|uniref:M3 family oligoendopeptidase n=1 Tax=Paenibacillus sp. N3/727 TaxID=2925845 RepID=UPI001F536BB2|nr:M3 family oligoendopeptidase [Paenibacillus sp. N3/727]UNK17744.1 M3 family oligoendopeptidase [Paenibacillus sp. N3/727]
MKKRLQQTWDLESIFPGGSHSPELAAFLDSLEKEANELRAAVQAANVPANLEEAKSLEHILSLLEKCTAMTSEAGAFVGCLAAQDQNDKKAVQLSGRVTVIRANLQSVIAKFNNLLRGIEDTLWEAWTSTEKVSPLKFILNESRDLAREKMNPELESLALELAIDGYHGWGNFYDTIVSKIQIPFEENGKTEILSAGQAFNKLHNPNREVRQEMFEKWEQAWTDSEDYCADTLNHLAGFRLKLYANRGWEDALKEPLAINRMSHETLDTMWAVIQDTKPVLVEYLNRKAKLLGLDGLTWTDVEAPIRTSVSKITYDEAAETIVEQFSKFSPKLAEFSQMAFDKSWIEAEDRPGKRPGGFCTSFKVSDQTRIFMTFGGTVSNVSTLAHELGHAYHQHLMRGLPVLNQSYAMNVAETASTFAEMIVADALVKAAKDEEEKLALLEEKIQNSVTFFMNIHARFLFETRFYNKRKEGLLNAAEISELMEEAQKQAYCEALSSYHPHFWASKLHFYSTGVPFYNFPYTFGFMFSTGLYVLAQQEGSTFADKYDALLRDTGIMTVEELAKKHLDVDLTKRDFWQSAADMCVSDIQQFLRMTDHLA